MDGATAGDSDVGLSVTRCFAAPAAKDQNSDEQSKRLMTLRTEGEVENRRPAHDVR